MPLNPVERKAFILSAMPQIANGMMSNNEMMQAIAQLHSRGGDDREVQVAITAYIIAVAMADEYDQENP